MFFSFPQFLHGASIPLSYMVGLIVLWFMHSYFLSLFLVTTRIVHYLFALLTDFYTAVF